MTIFIILIVVVIVIGAVALVVVGIRRSSLIEEDPLTARLAEYSQRGETASLEEIELSQPFTDRVILPLLKKLGDLSSRFTPQHLLEETTKKLELAGNPMRLEASTFLVMRFIVAGVFGFFVLLLTIMSSRWSFPVKLLMVIIFTVLGFYFPQLWMKSKIDNRQKQIRKAMPDALDLLTICVEAGLGFDASMSKVNEKWENELSVSFGRAIKEIQLGKSRRQALKDMADRIGLSEMTSFVAAVIQSEQLGVSMAKVLRIQSDQMRIRRRQLAEEEARKMPVKLIFPMGLFIFPALMIVLMTPAALKFWVSFVQSGMF